jgi:hypothetical protein
MGLYERLVLPRLLDWAMRDTHLAPYRSRTLDAAEGLVLEIGAGSGLNFPRYAGGSSASSRSIRRRNCSDWQTGGAAKRAPRSRCYALRPSICRLPARRSTRW